MCLYQFLIAVRSDGAQLTTVDGETTSHLMGMFYRTIRMLENGIKPCYVFDGKPPQMKSGELAKRTERREEAQKALEKATEAGDAAEVEKFNRRLVKVTKAHSEEAKQLLKLMGIPYVDAPCEAEAQCAALVKSGKVFATATEDMDALTFGTNILLRHLTASEARKLPVQEFHYDKVLQGLELSKEQFIDLCILLGCDYCESIKGIGPKRAIELINQHKSIENIINNIDKKKYIVPNDWNYMQARELFVSPEVANPDDIEVLLFIIYLILSMSELITQINLFQLKWTDPDEEGLVQFLCGDRQFSEERIRNGFKKIMKTRTTTTQGRLDSFFTVTNKTDIKTLKRKAEDAKKQAANKKAKTSLKTGRKPK